MAALHRLVLVLTALTLVPLGAHLFELPAKIALPAEAYLATQRLYDGWALFGLVQVPAALLCLWLAARLRRARRPYAAALAAGLLLALTLVLFFAFTWPANQATANWTRLPDGWEALRARWEWSHAANAVIAFLAFCCLAGGTAPLPRRAALP